MKEETVQTMPNTMQVVCFLEEVGADAREYVGGKAYTLARLLQAGFPVPPGFVVTTTAYRAFLAANLTANDPMDDDRRQALFLEGRMPSELIAAFRLAYRVLGPGGPVAVRSSASDEDGVTFSFAGQYETVLNVTDFDGLLDAIRHCWASLDTARVESYRQRFRLGESCPAMAVLVQRMVPATLSGVAFTMDPVSGRQDVVVIEVVRGGGEALVSGQVTPRRYVISKVDTTADVGGVMDGCLSSVVEMVQRIETWAGSPQDVEWAWVEREEPLLYVLQARPVTQSADVATGRRILWTRDNVGEVIPDPVTPLSWSLLNPLGNRAFARLMHRLGAGSYPDDGLFGRFYGRVYFNQTLFQEMMERFYPSLGGWRAAPRLMMTALRVIALLLHLPAESRQALRAVRARRQVEAAEPVGLESLLIADLQTRLEIWRRLEIEVMVVHLAVSVMGELFCQAVDKLLAWWDAGEDSVNAATLTGRLKGVLSAEVGQALANIADDVWRDARLRQCVLTSPPAALATCLEEMEAGRRLLTRLSRFLEEHGHSTAQEFELAAPRWRDDPTPVFVALQAHVRYRIAASEREIPSPDPATIFTEGLERRMGILKRGVFRRVLHQARSLLAWRENLKYHFVIAHSRLRELYLALAARLVAAGCLERREDIFFLTADEIDELVDGAMIEEGGTGGGDGNLSCADLVCERRRQWEQDCQRPSPTACIHIQGTDRQPYPLDALPSAPATAPTSNDARGPLLRGVAASPGVYTGRACVLSTPGDGSRLRPGDVLIAPAVSPGWGPLLLAAGALVTEIGGVLSHGAIIAREYGLPAVLNVPDVVTCIQPGQWVQVDGSQGTVRLLEGEA